ncbi:hypothetical protein HPB48_004914 [Haemaphysalis longicornis]|uniref:EF-hand domain-containing protein n=1 Tax=Haemaphysalis longicornis TaxID=44386 RepID=A0A9J6GEC9_HAELO|nr:hypothetical protein HPB48_004914 [Haemaphysalis longicornis]
MLATLGSLAEVHSGLQSSSLTPTRMGGGKNAPGVLTIFSASNYYDIGSNRGAYVKLVGPKLVPHTVMFVSTAQTRKATIQQRSGYIEHSALRELKQHVYACQTPLRAEFQKYDPQGKGQVSLSDWCSVMEKVVGLHVTWRILCPKIAQVDPVSGAVLYETTFDEYALTNKLAQVSTAAAGRVPCAIDAHARALFFN